MKLTALITTAIATLSIGFMTTSFAASAADSYYPPERIHCSLLNGKLNCEGYSHQYLVEDTYTADMDETDQVFAFSSGAAYFNADKSEATVFFTYRNSNFKNVKLKTSVTSIRPDLENGYWIKVDDDLYVCKDGYMHCPITALPARHK
jgi:hypothetical protein